MGEIMESKIRKKDKVMRRREGGGYLCIGISVCVNVCMCSRVCVRALARKTDEERD